MTLVNKDGRDEAPWLAIARKELGVNENVGDRIFDYWRMNGKTVSDRSIPWCGVFVGAVLEWSGIKSPQTAWARDYLKFGWKLDQPWVGCIVILDRGNGFGHVGFYIGKSRGGTHVLILGGNQGDKVSIEEYPVEKVLGYRWPAPESVDEDQPSRLKPDPGTTSREPTSAEIAEKLQKSGSRTINSASRAKRLVRWLFGGSATSGLAEVADQATKTIESFQPMRPYVEKASAFFAWAWSNAKFILPFVALAVAYELYVIIAARVDDHNTGANTGRSIDETDSSRNAS